MDQGPVLNYGLILTNNKIRPHYANSKADYAQWARIYNFVQNVKFCLFQDSFSSSTDFKILNCLLLFSLQNTVKLFAHFTLIGPTVGRFITMISALSLLLFYARLKHHHLIEDSFQKNIFIFQGSSYFGFKCYVYKFGNNLFQTE